MRVLRKPKGRCDPGKRSSSASPYVVIRRAEKAAAAMARSRCSRDVTLESRSEKPACGPACQTLEYESMLRVRVAALAVRKEKILLARHVKASRSAYLLPG